MVMDLTRLEDRHGQPYLKESVEDWFKSIGDNLNENPIKRIVIKPTWYGLQDDIMDFIEQLLRGYLWEIKFGHRFIAKHTEQEEVESILYKIAFLHNREKDTSTWWPTSDEEYQLLMYDFARLMPKLWD